MAVLAQEAFDLEMRPRADHLHEQPDQVGILAQLGTRLVEAAHGADLPVGHLRAQDVDGAEVIG